MHMCQLVLCTYLHAHLHVCMCSYSGFGAHLFQEYFSRFDLKVAHFQLILTARTPGWRDQTIQCVTVC